MNKNRFIVLTVLISIMIAMIGCAGGGGGSPAVVEKDVAGITATLNKFAASLQNGTAANSGVFSQSTGHTPEILYIQDFGKDINDPGDNETWYFSVNPADIVQPSSDIAYLKASRMLPNGATLWLSFVMVREQGVWLIETMELTESPVPSVSNFVTASYFPVTPGASLTYSITENGIVSPQTAETGFAKTAMVIDGIKFYQMLESFIYGNKKISGRPSRRSIRAVTEFSSSYFGFDSYGQLCIYDPYINNGTPYVAFKASYAFGAKDQFTEVYSYDGSIETTVTDVTIGFPLPSFVTPLRTFSVVPLTFDFTITSNSYTYKDKTVIYLAEGRGIVGYDYYDESNVLIAQERLLKTYNNGILESNHPVVTAPGSSQNVVAGKNISSVQFAVADGRTPVSWSAANLPSGLTLSSTGLLSGQLDSGVPLGSINLTVSATDMYSRRGDLPFTLNVVDASAVTLTVPTSSQNAIIGQPIAQMQFSAAGSGSVTWSSSGAPAGVSISSAGLLSGTPAASTAPGAYAIVITATNALGQSGSFVYTLNLTAPRVTFSPSFSSTMGYPGRLDAWLMLDGSSFQYADYSIAAIEVDPVSAVNYIPFFADSSGYAQVGVISFQSGVIISFKVQITRKSDLAVFTSAVQTISAGPAFSKR